MAELSLLAAWQRATHHLLTALDGELRALSLTHGEINALACFGDEREVAVRELITRTGQRPSTFTGVLDRLERRGLVERRPNAADRRSTVAVLTTEGLAVAGDVRDAFRAVERRLPDDVRAAARALADVDPSTLAPLE